MVPSTSLTMQLNKKLIFIYVAKLIFVYAVEMDECRKEESIIEMRRQQWSWVQLQYGAINESCLSKILELSSLCFGNALDLYFQYMLLSLIYVWSIATERNKSKYQQSTKLMSISELIVTLLFPLGSLGKQSVASCRS